MLIKVIYNNGKYDFVKPFLLDNLISSGRLKMFKRSDGWAEIGISPIRQKKSLYIGIDRRNPKNNFASANQSTTYSISSSRFTGDSKNPIMNCWEFKKCGREPGGINANTYGVCPAAIERKLDGTHGGKNAGRACWVVAGTMCKGKPQGTFANKYKECGRCDFYKKVKREEEHLIATIFLLDMVEEGNDGQENDSITPSVL